MTQPTHEQQLREIISLAILDGQNQIHDLKSEKATPAEITDRMFASLNHHSSKANTVVTEALNAKHREFVKEVRAEIEVIKIHHKVCDVPTKILSLPLLQLEETNEK